jgi:SAM-dependent methyltransferase
MHPYKKDLFRFCVSSPIDELLHKCASAVNLAIKSSNPSELDDLTEVIDALSNIIKLSNGVIQANVSADHLNLSRTANLPIESAALMMLADYTQKTHGEILNIMSSSGPLAEELWNRLVEDNPTITPSLLDEYYAECGEKDVYLGRYYNSIKVSLACALRGYIALIAKEIGGKCFDFGGGIGDVTSTMSFLGLEDIYFLESDQKQLDFVRWKDAKCNIKNVKYIGANDFDEFLEANKETFHFGVSTELLEHVYDPPGVLETMASLLAPGGCLFLTTSFHVYPHPGHLESNVKYTGQEEALLAPYGLTRIPIDNPLIPFLPNWKLFQKAEKD